LNVKWKFGPGFCIEAGTQIKAEKAMIKSGFYHGLFLKISILVFRGNSHDKILL